MKSVKKIFSVCGIVFFFMIYSISAYAAGMPENIQDENDSSEEMVEEHIVYLDEDAENSDYSPYVYAPDEFQENCTLYDYSQREKYKNVILTSLVLRRERVDLTFFGIDDESEMKAAFYEVLNENPGLFYSKRGFGYNIHTSGNRVTKIEMRFLYNDELGVQEQELYEQKIEKILSIVDDNMSDVEKALVIHDYLAQHCEYDMSSCNCQDVSHSAYGAIVNEQAVCEGYALAYKDLLTRVGIESEICTSGNMNHAWNLVKIDGQWYHVDVTWDDPVFDTKGQVCHDYFLLSDSEIKNREHYDWDIVGKCNSTKYDASNYWWREVNSQIVVENGVFYYIKNTSDGFDLMEKGKNTKVIYHNANTFLLTCYGVASYLSRQGEYMFFNDSSHLYAMKLSDLVPITIYTADNDKTIVEAMVYEDGKAHLFVEDKSVVINIPDNIKIVQKTIDNKKVKGVSFEQSSYKLSKGQKLKINAYISPSDAHNKEVIWSSSDYNIADVDDQGNVTGISSGSAVITAVSKDGTYKYATAVVTVNTKVSDILFDIDEAVITMDEGDFMMVTATVVPSDADNLDLVWSSSNTDVAFVGDYGNLFAISQGEAIITATAADGSGVYKSFKIIVKPVSQDKDCYATYQGYDFCRDENDDVRCYDSNGNPVINEFRCDGTYTYYFQLDGTAMRNRLTYHPDGEHVIYFDEEGHEVFSNFHHVEKSIAGDAVDDLCFFDVYGYMYVDVMTYDQAGKNLYYVNPCGVIEQGKWFEFSSTCVWAGTDKKVGKGYGYANADGTLLINTYTYNWLGNYVYMQGDGHMK